MAKRIRDSFGTEPYYEWEDGSGPFSDSLPSAVAGERSNVDLGAMGTGMTVEGIRVPEAQMPTKLSTTSLMRTGGDTSGLPVQFGPGRGMSEDLTDLIDRVGGIETEADPRITPFTPQASQQRIVIQAGATNVPAEPPAEPPAGGIATSPPPPDVRSVVDDPILPPIVPDVGRRDVNDVDGVDVPAKAIGTEPRPPIEDVDMGGTDIGVGGIVPPNDVPGASDIPDRTPTIAAPVGDEPRAGRTIEPEIGIPQPGTVQTPDVEQTDFIPPTPALPDADAVEVPRPATVPPPEVGAGDGVRPEGPRRLPDAGGAEVRTDLDRPDDGADYRRASGGMDDVGRLEQSPIIPQPPRPEVEAEDVRIEAAQRPEAAATTVTPGQPGRMDISEDADVPEGALAAERPGDVADDIPNVDDGRIRLPNEAGIEIAEVDRTAEGPDTPIPPTVPPIDRAPVEDSAVESDVRIPRIIPMQDAEGGPPDAVDGRPSGDAGARTPDGEREPAERVIERETVVERVERPGGDARPEATTETMPERPAGDVATEADGAIVPPQFGTGGEEEPPAPAAAWGPEPTRPGEGSPGIAPPATNMGYEPTGEPDVAGRQPYGADRDVATDDDRRRRRERPGQDRMTAGELPFLDLGVDTPLIWPYMEPPESSGTQVYGGRAAMAGAVSTAAATANRVGTAVEATRPEIATGRAATPQVAAVDTQRRQEVASDVEPRRIPVPEMPRAVGEYAGTPDHDDTPIGTPVGTPIGSRTPGTIRADASLFQSDISPVGPTGRGGAAEGRARTEVPTPGVMDVQPGGSTIESGGNSGVLLKGEIAREVQSVLDASATNPDIQRAFEEMFDEKRADLESLMREQAAEVTDQSIGDTFRTFLKGA